MCQARVYVRQDDGERLVMEDVALIEVDGDACVLSTLFGEQERVEGRIVRIDLLKHNVYLEGAEDA